MIGGGRALSKVFTSSWPFRTFVPTSLFDGTQTQEMPARNFVAAFVALAWTAGLLLAAGADTLGVMYNSKKANVSPLTVFFNWLNVGYHSSVFVGADSPQRRRRITTDNQVFHWSRQLNETANEAPSTASVSSPPSVTNNPSPKPTMSSSRHPSSALLTYVPSPKPTAQVSTMDPFRSLNCDNFVDTNNILC